MTEIATEIPVLEHYESIETLPIWNWSKILESKNMEYLLLKPKKLSEEEINVLYKIWQRIYEEYIMIFGFSEDILRVHEKNKQIAILQIKKINTGDDAIENFIKKKRNEILAMGKHKTKGDIYKTKMIIETKLGFRLSLKEVTVREFYTYLKELNAKKA
jgi:hypothetical protein